MNLLPYNYFFILGLTSRLWFLWGAKWVSTAFHLGLRFGSELKATNTCHLEKTLLIPGKNPFSTFIHVFKSETQYKNANVFQTFSNLSIGSKP